jgi:phosphatidylserine/phosphatidylglycerophosphate/cardiolipin synthase-like enzyme
MIFTPAADPAFSDADPTLNGGYDDYAEMMQRADYEVLFTTMAYTKAANRDSPGAILARSVVDLYEKVKANPQNFPRGMTVRILLGNSPAPSFELLELDGGLWYVLNDLREAGLEKMVDPGLGWRVEVGNYAGSWPHSHVKTMVIDGKTVVASGFNHEYKPLAKDHPSGKGYGDTDTGLVMTGPVAQHSRRIYDQLWTGAVQRHCPDLNVSEAVLRLTCRDSLGISDHVPEVMRYSIADDEAFAFSMYRDQVYDEADQQLLAAFNAANESIDVAQAMFSMAYICNLNNFYEVCDFGQALPYMEALMNAAEKGAKLRIVLAPYPFQHIENVIAMEIFNKEAVERGITQRVEIRMYGDLLHTKSAMIDGEFVIVGSHNLHWSAFGGDNTLNEYSLGVGDPNAAEQYQRFFDYLWERSPSRTEPVS